ncbi:hypothetical protein EUX98_g2030 [Antrodiella citrinella]|uniref:Mediator of RNA polymerase II transcription subunit 13 n=1 Tax=Antrodiella citrinella TaxID=2447956 RepID=A0A4S4N1K2_9APHY|nr:hypothetical protein EUX98_g2030 [Antrodiella citrinella]
MQDDTADFSPTSPEVKLEAIDVPPIASTSAGPGLDSFPIFDSSWTQSTGDFLPQSSDYGMNFSLNMDDGDDLGMGESFGVFTEDDFDFFNGPTLASSSELAAVMPTVPDGFLAAAFSPAAIIGPSLTALVRSPLEEGLPSGVGPPSAQSQPSPWAVFHGTESLTPQPEPIHTPKHLSERIHTTVQIIEQRITNIPSSHPISRYPNAFDPIPFNTTHRISDGKYVLGKFALPSPPSEDDTDYKGSRTSLNLSITLPSAKWKSSYSSATDPRVGMTQRLVGVKRKLSAQGGRVPNVSPGRFRDHDEWIQADLPLVEDASDSDNEECWIVDEQDPLSPDPKPATPPPSYLPLGPTLLQTYFHYQFLQPYTVALDTSGTAAHNTTTTPAAISAPTPISPAAILGSSSEKTKSLEAASQILLREAVENPVWADAWRASAAASNTRQCPSDIWPADLKYTASLLNGVESSSCPVDLDTLLQPSSDGSALRAVDCPLLTIGKAGEIMNILPTALRFWEKLGLSPRNGPKDITAFIVFDQTHLQEEREVGELLGRLSAVYTTKRYGKHDAGRAPGCTQDGIFPTRFESIRKTLSTFATGITERSSSSIVVYIVTPDHILRMTSPILRQVLSAIKRISKNRQATSPILFQFVPERLLAASAPSSLEGASLEAFVDSVYDRILCPVDRHVSCRYPPSVEDTRMYLQFPAFTLAKPLHPEVKFVKAEAVEILDVVDRYSMLHVGYQVTRQGKWLLTTCVDHRGEVHDLRAWLMPEDDTVDSFTVNSVWDFAMSMATKANVEWHVVIAKRGVMTAHEMDAWSSHLEVLVRGETTPPMQVSLLSVDQDNPWYFFVKPSDTEALSSSATRGFKATGNLAMDVSSTTLALLSSRTTPIPMRIYPGIAVDQLSSVDSKESPSMDELGVLPLATQTLVHIPSQTDHTCISMLHLHFLYFSRSHNSTSTLTDAETSRNVAKSFQELKVLAQARWATRGSNNLPLHFAALEVMLTTLDEPDGLLDL